VDALDEKLGTDGGRRPGVHHRLDRIETELRATTTALGQALSDRRLGEAAMDLPTARFLNWCESPEGPAARAGLWFNPPVPVEYTPQGPEVLLVNERIVELPFAFGCLARLPAGARILDVGAAESTVGLALASLGHRVHAVDPRPIRLEHPGLTAHACRLQELGESGFDAALALSAIEHFGLSHYIEGGEDDRAALAAMHERLKPGGLLVLTVPIGPEYTADDFQRIYRPEDVRKMVEDAGFAIERLDTVWRRDRLTWTPGAPSDRGVALVAASAYHRPAGPQTD
jgi:2-polyprenyl-3-methyl-5-hydroxy-6-metoxy-1,4-benzoquinol methylase